MAPWHPPAQGGTIIGTARSKEFRTLEGRRKATYNLMSRGIDALVCIGGDGSLTGANMLRKEWPEHLAALVKDGPRARVWGGGGDGGGRGG